jgi:hypothetical protein
MKYFSLLELNATHTTFLYQNSKLKTRKKLFIGSNKMPSYAIMKPYIYKYRKSHPEARKTSDINYYNNNKQEIFNKFYEKSRARTRYNKEAKLFRNILIDF